MNYFPPPEGPNSCFLYTPEPQSRISSNGETGKEIPHSTGYLNSTRACDIKIGDSVVEVEAGNVRSYVLENYVSDGCSVSLYHGHNVRSPGDIIFVNCNKILIGHCNTR